MDGVFCDYCVILAGNARPITLRGPFERVPPTVIYGVHGGSEQPKNRWECASLIHCISVSSRGSWEINI